MYLNCTATPAKPHFFFSFSFFLFFLPPQKQEGLNRTIKVHWIGIYIHICIDGDLWVRIRGVYPQPNKAEPSKRAAEAAATAVESTLIEPSSVGNLWLCCVVSLPPFSLSHMPRRCRRGKHFPSTYEPRTVEHRNEVTWQLQLMLIARRRCALII